MAKVKFIIDKRTPVIGERRIYRDVKSMINRFARTGDPEKPQHIILDIDEDKGRVKITGLTDDQAIEIMDTFAITGCMAQFKIDYIA